MSSVPPDNGQTRSPEGVVSEQSLDKPVGDGEGAGATETGGQIAAPSPSQEPSSNGLEPQPANGEYSVVRDLQVTVEHLQAELAERDRRLREYIEAHQHAVKEMEDARARLERDREEELDRARAQIAAQLLDVADDLERATQGASSTGNLTAVLEGVELVHRQVLTRLSEMGVVPMDATGERFDPNLHEAVGMVPVADAAKDQVVLEEERKGYTYKGRLLRAARVVVGAAGD